jgi:Chaperone of endosialidase
VNAAGRLSVGTSSERYKTGIVTMDDQMTKLQQLRPVTFHLKTEPLGTLQYGLIAEEVAKIYPELVVRDPEGRIQGVRYDELAPMLLNEVQKQQRINAAQLAGNESQATKIAALQQQLSAIQVALAGLVLKDKLVARR